MTPSTIPMLIDDTGREASETVRFGVDGRAYEIDLPARRASELRSMADRYIRVARKLPAAPSRAQQPRPGAEGEQEQPRRIRSRARQRALRTSPSGRVPQHGADGYAAAVPVAPVRSQPPGPAEPQPAPSGGEPGLTDGERQELRTIAEAASPRRNIVASRLRTKGLTDRDTAGHWWLTDAGRRELTSA
jgi:hypothetical protein